MLSPEQLQAAGDAVAAIYNDIEAKALDHMVEALLNTDSIDQRTMTELGLLAQSQAPFIRNLLDERKDEINEAVRDTCERLIEASDKDDMRRVGGDQIFPMQIASTIDGVARILERDNLAMEEGMRSAFLDASIEAVTRVNAGTMTRERALHHAVRKLEGEGVPIITYRNTKTGMVTVRNKVDVAVRRHVRTQIAQDGADMTMQRIERLGIDLVEVSSHEGSRPEHALWQGRCYSLSGDKTIDGVRYRDFYEATGYGNVSGLMGANCRHSFAPYRHGAPRAYEPDPKSPTGLSNNEIYEYEQKQRALERDIREAKRQLRGAEIEHKAFGTDESRVNLAKAKATLKSKQASMRKLIDTTNAKAKPGTKVLTRRPYREWAGDMPKYGSEKFMMALPGTPPKKKISLHIKQSKSVKEYLSELKDKVTPMTFMQANSGKVNPMYWKVKNAFRNCQTCAAAYVARRQGFNIAAKPYIENKWFARIASKPWSIWIDPSTNRQIQCEKIMMRGSTRIKDYLEQTIKQNEIYTLAFREGYFDRNDLEYHTRSHAACVERDKRGKLFIYDPQNSRIFRGKKMSKYLEKFYEFYLFRCDNAILDIELADKVFMLGE